MERDLLPIFFPIPSYIVSQLISLSPIYSTIVSDFFVLFVPP